MKKTKLRSFLEWLTEHGPANWSQIKAAGFSSIFNGRSRQRLIDLGVVCIDKATIDLPLVGAHRTYNVYRATGKPYAASRPGRKAGFRLNDQGKKQMMIRLAITVLSSHGYTVVPPEVSAHG